MDDTLQMVPTKGSQITKKNIDFQAVVFSGRKKTELASQETKNPIPTGPEFDIKRATKEIIKFGAKGFYQRRRDRTLKSLAIELGAKPEKNRCHNYENLKDIRKKNRERKEEHLKTLAESHTLSKKNHFKKNSKRKSKSDINILNKYGKRR